MFKRESKKDITIYRHRNNKFIRFNNILQNIQAKRLLYLTQIIKNVTIFIQNYFSNIQMNY